MIKPATNDVLPGVTLTQPLSGPGAERPMQLRAGYGRTVNRPDLRELSPSTYFDPKTQREVVGNPDLARARIDNIDVRWEWYLSPDESLSVAGFAKQFTDPIEVVIEVGAAGRQTFANAAAATNNGLEVDLRKSLALDENGPLAPVYLGVNGAWISSSVDLGEIGGSATSRERPLQGQSPWVLNLQLSYEPGEFPPGGGAAVQRLRSADHTGRHERRARPDRPAGSPCRRGRQLGPRFRLGGQGVRTQSPRQSPDRGRGR